MYAKRGLVFAAVAALLLAMTAATTAQTTGGAVTGTVLDANGAAVANATVTIRNTATGQTLTTQTTDAGSYTFPNVPVGDFIITIEGPGFQPVTQEVKVTLNQESSVNATLQVAGTQVVIDVTAASEALVQTDSSQLGRSYETRQVQDLPIFGDQNNLALLSPNVVVPGSGVLGDGGSVGGTRPRGNNFVIDGVDNNDPSITGAQTSVIQDAIQEFSLLTNNFNAEFGTGAGGQFNTVTKTGTNEFHGSGFVYVQKQGLNAASTQEEALLRTPLSGGGIAEKPRFNNPRYGFTFGGPIVKNKLFFFGAFQREQFGAGGSSTAYLAPTEEGLNQLALLPGASQTTINLLRNNLILPTAATVLSGITRNAGGSLIVPAVLGATGIPFGSVTLVTPIGFTDNLSQINIDHLPNTTDQFRYRLSTENFSSEQAGFGNPKFNNFQTLVSRLFSATWVRAFNPSVVNDLRVSYRRAIFGFPLVDESANSFPNFTVPALGLQLGANSNLPQDRFDNSYQIFDTVNYVRGQHNFKFGGEFRRLIRSGKFLPRSRGDYWYSTLDLLIMDQAPDTRNLRGVGSATFTGNQSKYYLFGQDDWKVTPNLTLNLGLRYEYLTLPRDLETQMLNSLASVPGVIDFNVPKTDKNNFAPRVGLAYSPDFQRGPGAVLFGQRGQSAIRANFSVAYSEVFQNLALLSLPPQFQQELNFQIASTLLGVGQNNFIQNGGLPATPVPPSTVAAARAATANYATDQTAPYTMAWTLSVQRELSPTMAVELRYQSTRSKKLPIQVRLNAAPVIDSALVVPTFFSQPTAEQLSGLPSVADLRARPGVRARRLGSFGFAGEVTDFEPAGSSTYDAGSVSLTRRFSRGLAFTAAYTFSKTIDDSTNELNSSIVNPRRPQDFFNLGAERGLSALDVPHRFVASFNYDIPLFTRATNDFVKGVFGGWQINGVFQAQSGQPVTPISAIDSNQNLDAAADRTIININGREGTASRVVALDAQGRLLTAGGATQINGLPITIAQAGVGATNAVAYLVVNPDAQYIQAGPFARATAGRNTLRSNGFNRTDAVLSKNFRFGEERYNLQIGAEVANLFNQRIRTIADNGTTPPISITATTKARNGLGVTTTPFNDVTSPLFNDYSAGDFSGRTVQLRAKFIF